jgi:hypothetical protein
LQSERFQHFRVFCLLKTFQNVDCSQRIPGHLWSDYHNFICASLTESSPKAFLIIGIVSTDECPSLKQNFMHLLAWSLWIRWSHKHKLRQQRPTNDWLAARESDYSQMLRKVSADWLPSFIKAMRPVLEILNMAGFFWDRSRINVPWM